MSNLFSKKNLTKRILVECFIIFSAVSFLKAEVVMPINEGYRTICNDVVNNILYNGDVVHLKLKIKMVDKFSKEINFFVEQFWCSEKAFKFSTFIDDKGTQKRTLSYFGKTCIESDEKESQWEMVPTYWPLKMQMKESIYILPFTIVECLGLPNRWSPQYDEPVITHVEGDVFTIFREFNRGNKQCSYNYLDEIMYSALKPTVQERHLWFEGYSSISAIIDSKHQRILSISATWKERNKDEKNRFVLAEANMTVEYIQKMPQVAENLTEIISVDEDTLKVIKPLKDVLPKNWKITNMLRNTIPSLWKGDPVALQLHLEDTGKMYFHQYGGFYYRPFLTVWVCPEKWRGTEPKISPIVQEYPARYLGKSKDFQVYYLSLGETTWSAAKEEVGKAFNIERFHSE